MNLKENSYITFSLIKFYMQCYLEKKNEINKKS